MGALNNDDLIRLAYRRLSGLNASMGRLSENGVTWDIVWHEYVDLYNEVHNKDFDSLRERFQAS